MDLMKLGSQLLSQQMGGNVSEDSAANALSSLLGDGKGGIDIGSLVQKFSGGDNPLGGIVSSWLGDGNNEGMGASQLSDMFGEGKLAEFAGKLGIDQEQAKEGLSNALPNLVDQASSGGNLLDSVGGLSGALDMAKKLF